MRKSYRYFKSTPRVAIVGATGAVGKELLTIMNERKFQFSHLDLVASHRSAGSTVRYREKDYGVQNLETFDFSKTDLAFFSAGTATSKQWAKKAADAGALVIDNTNAFRMDVDSPLVVPQVNEMVLDTRPRSGIIANPNCSTIQMVRVLAPIHEAFGLKRVVVSTYQAASGAGLTGIDELKLDAISVLSKSAPISHKRFPVQLGFNVIPQVDVFLESGFTLEEQKMVQESRKILSLPKLDLTATAVRVPVVNGHSEAIYLETENEMNLPQVLSRLSQAEEVTVFSENRYPTPRFMPSNNHVHVGRVRLHPENNRGLWCWVVADNLRIGAALNAIQIAERIV